MFCDIKNHIIQEKRIMTEQGIVKGELNAKTYLFLFEYIGVID